MRLRGGSDTSLMKSEEELGEKSFSSYSKIDRDKAL
jgi:hypothetical protein